MKKHLVLSLGIASALAFNAQAMNNNDNRPVGDDVYGQTFMSIRPEFESAFPEKTTMFRDRAKARCDGHGGAFQFVPFGGRSTKSKDLMKYFAPSPKTTLRVDTDNESVRDINPTFFGLQVAGAGARYQSNLEFRPERTVGGLGITYRQYVGRECEVADRNWWLEISAPILYVSNKVNLVETDRQVTGTFVEGSIETMDVAFTGLNQVLGTTGDARRMQYGLINNARTDDNTFEGIRSPKKAMRATGSDIELKLGYDYYTSECYHFDGYVGLHIPASRKPNGQYLFEAIPGFNQHFGFMTGMSTGVEIWRDCDRSFSWEVETNHRYFIQNTQTRSFDLKNRPWSRYMFITDNQTGNILPGINVLTRDMKVQPRYSFDINSALVYGNDCGFSAELGYNFFARQGERVRLKEDFESNRYYVTAINGANRPNATLTNRLSNIGNLNEAANDVLDSNPSAFIRAEDLGLLSAATPAQLTNLVYGSLGYAWDDRCYPLFVGLGGSYEFTGKNTAPNRWLVWGKFGVSI